MKLYLRNAMNLLALGAATLAVTLAMPARSQPAQWNYSAQPGQNSVATYPGDVVIGGVCTGCGGSGDFPGDVSVGGNLSVVGNITGSNVTLSGGLNTTGNISTGATGTLTVGGVSSFTGLMSGTNLQLSTLMQSSSARVTSLGGVGSRCVQTDASGNLSAFTIACSSVDLNAVLQTWTGAQIFDGSGLAAAVTFKSAAEYATITAAAPAATTNFDFVSQPVQYYTSNAANNWTLNIRGSASQTFNNVSATGRSYTFAVLTTQGGTAFYNSAVTIDGVAVTPKWVGGAPSSGTINSLEAYVYTIIKTGSAAYIVIASKTAYT